MSGERVLVVDDEPQILRALRTTLRGAGYKVDAAETAEGALTAAAAHPPEAVILDLVLPDGNGTDVCRELRSWSEAPVIVLSAVGEERREDRGARRRRRRLRDEAVQRRRVACTPACGAQAARARAGEPVIEIGELAHRRP